jgi:hypothetical protein
MTTKKILKNIFKKLESCTQGELKEYATSLYMQKQEFDKRTWGFIQKAIDIQEEYFKHNSFSPVVVPSELKEGEV